MLESKLPWEMNGTLCDDPPACDGFPPSAIEKWGRSMDMALWECVLNMKVVVGLDARCCRIGSTHCVMDWLVEEGMVVSDENDLMDLQNGMIKGFKELANGRQ